MKASFRNATAPDLEENPLVDLIGAVFLQIGLNLLESGGKLRGAATALMRWAILFKLLSAQVG
jgi:hypothetical protein